MSINEIPVRVVGPGSQPEEEQQLLTATLQHRVNGLLRHIVLQRHAHVQLQTIAAVFHLHRRQLGDPVRLHIQHLPVIHQRQKLIKLHKTGR